MDPTSLTPDPWQRLRKLTPARIALGRAGGSLPTAEVLRFSTDHALARDAVQAELDIDRLKAGLQAIGPSLIVARTRAPDRTTYLQRPDLGRQLDASSEAELRQIATTDGCDVALIVADGLSAFAAQSQAPPVLAALVPMLIAEGLRVSPIVIVRQARVALQDAVGGLLRARCALTLIGERPGLGTADSLGAYLVFDPKPGNTDANRNCVSNIRPAGLPPAEAAKALHFLITACLSRQISGVHLKDDRLLTQPAPAPREII